MEMLWGDSSLTSGGWHHAYLFIGAPDEGRKHFASFLEILGVEKNNNPDVFTFELETFGIDDARHLSALSAEKAFGSKKVFLLSPQRFTLEAQNALLKTLEEPSPETHFFLVTRERGTLLPTLLSRVQILEMRRGNSEEQSELGDKFLTLDLTRRLNFAKEFSESGESLPAFLDRILLLVRTRGGASADVLRQLLEFRRLSDGQSASGRLILEHLSFII